MIVQNVNVNQAAPPVRAVREDVPKAVAAEPISTFTREIADAKQAVKPPSPEALKNAVDVINTVLRQSNNNLEFSVDHDTNKSIVKLVDTESGELIRQYPSEETLAISRSIDRFQQGLLLKQEA